LIFNQTIPSLPANEPIQVVNVDLTPIIPVTQTVEAVTISAGTNTYTGSTTVTGGTLQLGNGGAIGGTGSILYVSGVTLSGDATTGGYERFDIRSTAPTLDLGGFTLTKSGSSILTLQSTENWAASGGTLELDISSGASIGIDAGSITIIND
jgi:autotransporter-associated beta strand protein